jgi:hypothetical protein
MSNLRQQTYSACRATLVFSSLIVSLSLPIILRSRCKDHFDFCPPAQDHEIVGVVSEGGAQDLGGAKSLQGGRNPRRETLDHSIGLDSGVEVGTPGSSLRSSISESTSTKLILHPHRN